MRDEPTRAGPRRFSLGARIDSLRYALRGLAYVARTQHNAWIHLAAALAVGAGGWLCRVDAADWRWLALAIALVWVAETVNTAFEYVCDVVSPEYHVAVARAKDIGAAAVLLCAAAALVIGALTFAPYLPAR